jgi:hypothetical protein
MAAIVENTRVSETVEPIGSACDHSVFAGWWINWSAVWVGALAAFCMLVLFGLIGGALGAHASATGSRLGDLKTMSIWGAILGVCAAFFSSVVGGWVATKVSGIRHAEPGMLQGAITWLVLVPMLCLAAALGAGSMFGGWYGGLVGPPAAQSSGAAVIQPQAAAGQIIPPPATIANAAVREDSTEAARAARNSALGAITGLLLGLAGGVVGGWMGCGEPMNLSHYKTRRPVFRHSV